MGELKGDYHNSTSQQKIKADLRSGESKSDDNTMKPISSGFFPFALTGLYHE